MNKVTSIIPIMCILLLGGCVDEFYINTGNTSNMIVIDALVTDYDSIQTVYIRRDRETISDAHRYPPIENASVHIADDNGWCADFKNMGDGRVFELHGHIFEPGRTYTLTVSVGERTFQSTEKMVKLPDIGKLKFYSRSAKDENLWCPVLYFKDNMPDEDNYYIFTDGYDYIRSCSQNRYLYIQRLSDVGFREDLNGIAISLGIGAVDYMISGNWWGDYYYYELFTISKRNYDYFGVIEDNLTNDGGIYKPTPASATSNFDGENVQGQFIAASKHIFHGRIDTSIFE